MKLSKKQKLAGFVAALTLPATMFLGAGNAEALGGGGCSHNDAGYGGDLCIHYDTNLNGSYFAYPLNLCETYNGYPQYTTAGNGQWSHVYHTASSADNFAYNQDAKVTTICANAGDYTRIPRNWHANLNPDNAPHAVENHNAWGGFV